MNLVVLYKPLNVSLLAISISVLVACGGSSSTQEAVNNEVVDDPDPIVDPIVDPVVGATVCTGGNDLTQIPSAYFSAMEKYTQTNNEYLVYVCSEDSNGDGTADFMVVETTNMPEHESVYHHEGTGHHEAFDYDTNKFKFADVYTNQAAHSAGNNMIDEQSIVMRIPINPVSAAVKTETEFATIGLAINGVSFFNENAAPGDQITDELFTFDQCSGHPQQQGVYHYHVDPVCLVRDLGGNVISQTITDNGQSYQWIEDAGNNAGLLLGFLLDGFPVYGPIGTDERDCDTNTTSEIDQYNGHSHCTSDFAEPIYHYHVKTANIGGTHTAVFWITNQYYYGEPGSVTIN